MRLGARFLRRVARGIRAALAAVVARGIRARLAAVVARAIRWPLAAVVARGIRAPLAAVAARGIRAPVAALVALAGAATALGMDVGSSSSERAAKRAAPAVLAQAAPVRAAERRARAPRRGGAAHYRRTVRKRVPRTAPAGFLPLYREAARRYGVNWRLIASIHRQETAFSTAPTTYHGLNPFGCCAGPMQFNVTNGPPSTWKLYREAFRVGRRPRRYPHRTRSHPSVYDDFDAIMAAAWLLSDSGAGRSLDYAAWWAAYSYYGHDLFGVTYASQVLARAVSWQRDGFCPNCALDEGLVEKFDRAYGAPIRRALTAERGSKKRKQRKRRKGERRDRGRNRKHRDDGSKDRAPRRSRAEPRPSTPGRSDKEPPTALEPPPPAPMPPSAPAATTPAPPPAPRCTPIQKLLGCGR